MAWNRSLELWTSSLRKSLSTGRVIESVSVILSCETVVSERVDLSGERYKFAPLDVYGFNARTHLLQGAFCPSSYGQRNVTLYIVAFRCLLNEISKYTRNYIKL